MGYCKLTPNNTKSFVRPSHTPSFYERFPIHKLWQFAVEQFKDLPFLLFFPVPVPCHRQQNGQSLYEDHRVILVGRKLKTLSVSLLPTLTLDTLLTPSTASSSATQAGPSSPPEEQRQQAIHEPQDLDSNILLPELQLVQYL